MTDPTCEDMRRLILRMRSRASGACKTAIADQVRSHIRRYRAFNWENDMTGAPHMSPIMISEMMA